MPELTGCGKQEFSNWGSIKDSYLSGRGWAGLTSPTDSSIEFSARKRGVTSKSSQRPSPWKQRPNADFFLVKMRTFDKPRSARGGWEGWREVGRGGLCLYKASIAGPSEHCKVIKHFVITRYINSQQSSGLTFAPTPSHRTPSHSEWLVSLDFSPGAVSNPNGVRGYWKGCHVEGCRASVGPEGMALVAPPSQTPPPPPHWQVKEGADKGAERKKQRQAAIKRGAKKRKRVVAVVVVLADSIYEGSNNEPSGVWWPWEHRGVQEAAGREKNPNKCPCRALVQSSVADVRRLD